MRGKIKVDVGSCGGERGLGDEEGGGGGGGGDGHGRGRGGHGGDGGWVRARPRLGGLLERLHERLQAKPSQTFVL